jgi:arsenite-transporting ATPase
LAIKTLTIVGGKGGVGKTTVACALGVESADAGIPTLIVSTDPAPSVADALGVAVGDTEVPVLPALWARQVDAPAAFASMERRYRERIDEVFDRLGFDAAHDRRILRDLLSLAPPGIDELYALATLGETLAEGRFRTIVVDPAPTGHLLRLLETPAVALDWSHRIMRLMLKYKEIAALGDAAADVLAFAKRTRAVRDLLSDATRTGLVLVALDEPVVRREAASLATAVTALGMTVGAVIWNRVATTAIAPLSTPGPVAQFAAPSESPSPRGVAAIRRWRDRWAPLT